MICDEDGNELKWNDVKDGMTVKIKAKNIHHYGYAFLYAAANGTLRESFYQDALISIVFT